MERTTRVLFDLSVVLDAFGRGPDAEGHSAEVLAHACNGRFRGHLSAACIDTLNDALTRTFTATGARERIRTLLQGVDIATVDRHVVDAALALRCGYLEDAITHECARINGIDLIVTLNPADYQDASLRVLTPTELLAELSPRHWTGPLFQPSAAIH